MAQLLKQWNEQLIQRRNARLEEAPEDIDNMIELAWCYIQTERIDDAAAIARKIDPSYEDTFAYHNLQGKLNYHIKNYAEGLYYLEIVEQIIRNMPDDGTSKTQKRKARLPEMLQLQGSCLIQLGRTEEAKSKLHEAMTLAPEDKEVLMIMGKILYNSGEYLETIDVFQQLLHLSAHAWVAELLMALCLYRLHRDQEAFHAVNRALSVQSDDLSLYILKMQILVDYSAEYYGISQWQHPSNRLFSIPMPYNKADPNSYHQQPVPYPQFPKPCFDFLPEKHLFDFRSKLPDDSIIRRYKAAALQLRPAGTERGTVSWHPRYPSVPVQSVPHG